MSVKVRIPKIVAVDFTEGIASRLEFECGCVTVRQGNARGVTWSYLERCPKHEEKLGAKYGGSLTFDPGALPEYWRR